MLESQLKEIFRKTETYIEECQNGKLEYPSIYYDFEGKLKKAEAKEFDKRRIDSINTQFEFVKSFYELKAGQPPTEKECGIGLDYLYKNKVSTLMRNWFRDSYNEEPQKQKIRDIPEFNDDVSDDFGFNR